MTNLEALATLCERHGWRVGLTVQDSPVKLAYLEVRGRRQGAERELLAKVPVTFWTMDEACALAATSLDRQGLLVAHAPAVYERPNYDNELR